MNPEWLLVSASDMVWGCCSFRLICLPLGCLRAGACLSVCSLNCYLFTVALLGNYHPFRGNLLDFRCLVFVPFPVIILKFLACYYLLSFAVVSPALSLCRLPVGLLVFCVYALYICTPRCLVSSACSLLHVDRCAHAYAG